MVDKNSLLYWYPDHFSAKHDYETTCYVPNEEKLSGEERKSS